VGEKPIFSGMQGCADMRHLIERGNTPSVLFGPGIIGTAHQANEYVDIDNLLTATKIYAQLILNSCQIAWKGVINLARIIIHSPELQSVIQGNTAISIDKDKLTKIFNELIFNYPQLENKVFINKEEKILKGTLLLFHNKKIIRERNISEYNKVIHSKDELIIISAFAGG